MHPDRRQLPLPFPHRHAFDARDFIAAESNRDALTWLDAAWPDRRLVIWGPAGCGKSHLLHTWVDRQGGVVSMGAALRDLDMIPHSGALAVDDADMVSPDNLLLHILNTARDRGLRLILSGREPPARWPVRLPDLSSRLRAITTVEIRPPDDALLAGMLMRLLSDRQLSVPPAVQTWLLTRLPRSAGTLRAVVARLDRESLSKGSAITRPLAEAVLRSADILGDEADEFFMPEFDPAST